MNLTHLNQWLNKTQTREAVISVETANLMNATLSRAATFQAGDPLPLAWHWLYFHEAVQGDDLGPDGHARLGGFLPPIPLPRRMWAGGKLEFIAPLHLGETAIKRSTIKAITPKQGKSGQLCFVTIDHEIAVNGETRLSERQTLVYREAVQPGKPAKSQSQPAPTNADFSATYQPDPMMLFRYSALTFNSHRIHYDVDYCRQVEGYPGLVVHGPLIATLLLDLFRQQNPDQPISQFEYRGISPLFSPDRFTVCGKRNGEVWATNHAGDLAMSATVK